MIKKINNYIPGIFLSLVIAVVAKTVVEIFNVKLISASVIAMFIGIALHFLLDKAPAIKTGVKFTSKKVLKFAIILLGSSLNFNDILKTGYNSLIIMFFTLATCFGIGYISGRLLKLNWKTSNLISAGTGICGGSAIAAISAVIDADNIDVAFAMGATFIFDMFMVVLFPFVGNALGMSDVAYGLWTGTAVNDTSSVVAAGYAYSEAAGDYAVMVKLTRTLVIVPVVIIFAFINAYIKSKTNGQKEKISILKQIRKSFPIFILGFLFMSGLRSFGVFSNNVSGVLKDISKFLMVVSLAAIGLNTSFSEIKKDGARAMLHGFIISLLVVFVSYVVIYFEQRLGIV
jgi:uncharacterized integral membrane protein (TIGR00698 family)